MSINKRFLLRGSTTFTDAPVAPDHPALVPRGFARVAVIDSVADVMRMVAEEVARTIEAGGAQPPMASTYLGTLYGVSSEERRLHRINETDYRELRLVQTRVFSSPPLRMLLMQSVHRCDEGVKMNITSDEAMYAYCCGMLAGWDARNRDAEGRRWAQRETAHAMRMSGHSYGSLNLLDKISRYGKIGRRP